MKSNNRLLQNPLIASIIRYFQHGAVLSTLFLSFMVLFVFAFVIPSCFLMIWSNFRTPISLSGEDLTNLKPTEWRLYTIETKGAVPIGILSWYETNSSLGVPTVGNSFYWGVYLVDDYYIYFTSDRNNDLERLPQTLTGRFSDISGSTSERLDELMPDKPPTMLNIQYVPQSLMEDLNFVLTTSMLCSLLLGMAWYFHHITLKNNGGLEKAPVYSRFMKTAQPILDTIFKNLKKILSQILSNSAQYNPSYRDSTKSQSNEAKTIRIDPNKVRIHNPDDE